MSEETTRYALYFAPPQANPWWQLLSRWLGYDAATGREVQQLCAPPLDHADFRAITEHARHYGGHATLKAPFRLEPNSTELNLLQAVDAFAAEHSAFPVPTLQVAHLSNFIALVPSRDDARINRIADACTTQFDHFRAPLSDAEMTRRLREPLDAVSLHLLASWGYPHVLERYRFHISLTGSLNAYPRKTAEDALQAAREVFEPISVVALHFDAICVFRQRSNHERFSLIHRAALAS
jgi:hypothetical protein